MVIKYLRKKGILKQDPDYIDLGEDPLFEKSPAHGQASKASIINRIAFGERTGKRVRFIGPGFGYEEEVGAFKSPHCVSLNGFSLHAATRIKARDRKGLEKLLMYMARPPIATERLTRHEDGSLLYKLKREIDGKTHILLDPLELLEKITAIIPPPGFNGIRYNGIFAPGASWREQIVRALKNPKRSLGTESVSEPPLPCRYSWAFLLKRVFNLNMDRCLKCGGAVKFIYAIHDPDVVKRVLEHIGISTDPPDRSRRKYYKSIPIFDAL
jgi:hypothetical protein